MSRKAQGLSMNVIIVAAIALLVLVILAIIFIGRMGTTTKGIDECAGKCISVEEDCGQFGTYWKEGSGNCYGSDGEIASDMKCCIGV